MNLLKDYPIESLRSRSNENQNLRVDFSECVPVIVKTSW